MMPIVLSSCVTERLNKAATAQGKIQASISLPDYPADCRAAEQHAAVTVGAELRSIIVRERGALDRANARVGRCAGFYDEVKMRFSGTK